MAQYALEAGVSWLATSVTVVASATWRAAKWSHRWIMDQAEEPEVPDDSPTIHEMFDHREKEFHNYVRQQIICMWLFMLLYLFAYWVISRLKRKTEREALYAGEEDYFVYRVSVWISSTATATSIGSLTLLPFSVIGVELLQLYDGNYYLQWLSYSLIGALWHYVFMLSNLSLFVLLPFSYFFIESQGFSTARHGNGITERIYEAMAVCFLFAFVLLCLAEVVLKILDYPVSFLSITSVNLPLIYSCVSFIGALLLLISTPYGFSRMFTYAREFLTVEPEEEAESETASEAEVVEEKLETLRDYPAGHHDEEIVLLQEASPDVVVPEDGVVEASGDVQDPRKDSDSGIDSGSTEEMRLDSEEDERTLEEDDEGEDVGNGDGEGSSTMTPRRRRRWNIRRFQSPPVVRTASTPKKKPRNPNYDYRNLNTYVKNYYRQERKRKQRSSLSDSQDDYWWTSRTFCRDDDDDEQEGVLPDDVLKKAKLTASGDFHEATLSSERRRTKSEEAIWKPVIETVKTSRLYKKAVEKRSRLVKFLMRMRMPVAVTILLILTTCSIVMVAINTLKLSFGYRSLPVYAQIIEVSTRHSFGLFGACIETLIIMYVMCTSFVGLYSLPLLRSLRPVRRDTPMPTIIINSSIILVVASALPVIVNTLGMTTFDLLGAHSSLQWLGVFRVVLAYNAAFVVLSVAFLANQLTASMRRQIWKWICHLRCACRRRPRHDVDPDDTIVILGGKKDD